MFRLIAAIAVFPVLAVGCGRGHGVSGTTLLGRVDRAYRDVPGVGLAYSSSPALARYGPIKSLVWLRGGLVVASLERVAGSVIVWPGGKRTYARLRGVRCWAELSPNDQHTPLVQPAHRFLHASRMRPATPKRTATGWLLPITFHEPASRGIGNGLLARPAFGGVYVLAVDRGSYRVSAVLSQNDRRWVTLRHYASRPPLPKTTPRCRY